MPTLPNNEVRRHKKVCRLIAPLGLLIARGAAYAQPPAAAPSPRAPQIERCPACPPDNEWNRRVDADPVDPSSASYIAGMNGGARFLHPDFGGGGAYGIPWVSVSGAQPRVPMSF